MGESISLPNSTCGNTPPEDVSVHKFVSSTAIIAAILAAVAALYWISRQNYLLFHGIVELFSIAVAWGVFMLVWNSRHFLYNQALVALGIAFFFLGVLDLLHTLAYKGMGVLGDPLDANLATQLWVAERYLQSLAFLAFPLLFGRCPRPAWIVTALALFTALILLTIFSWRVFPACFVEGRGLTAFKVASEYINIALLVCSIILLHLRRQALDANVYRLLKLAVGFTIAAGLSFTLYRDVYGLLNLAGHLFMSASFVMVYIGLIRIGLTKPYALLFRELAQKERLLRARLRLSDFAHTKTVPELLQKILDESEQLTESQIGFIHFVEEDQETLALQMWSSNTLQNMCTAEGAGKHYPISQAGVWVDCLRQRKPVIHNDYAALPHRKGTPPGHAPVIRELIVPIFQNERVVAILGVGNKATDYSQADVDVVTELGGMAWDLVVRKHAESELRRSQEHYRMVADFTYDWEYWTDSEGKFLYISPSCERVSGYPPAFFLEGPRALLNIVHPEDRDGLASHLGKITAVADTCELEFRLIRKDGEIRWINHTCWGVFTREGAFAGRRGSHRDITENKRAQDKLRASLETHHLAMDAATEGLWDWNIKTGEVYYSSGWAKILGLEAVPPNYPEWETRVHPDDRAATLESLQEHLSGRSEYWSMEHRIRVRDGSWKWVLGRGRVVERDAEGCACRMVGTMTDIMDRKKAEQAMAARNQGLEALHRLSEAALGDAPLVAALQKIAEDISRSMDYPIVAVEFYDEARQEMEFAAAVGIPTAAAGSPLRVPLDQTISGLVARNGRPLVELQALMRSEYVNTTLRALGVRTFMCFPMSAEDRVIGALSLATPEAVTPDEQAVSQLGSFANFIATIVERKRAEAALRESEEKSRRLLEALTDGILVREDDIIVYANTAALRLFRADREEDLVRKSYLSLVHPDDRAETIERVRKVIQENQVAPLREHRVLALDGTIVEVESIGLPIRYRGVLQIIGVFRDITERKKVAQEKEKLELQLRQAQKMEAIGTLAGGIAHDFNNILSVIIGNSEMLTLKEELPPSLRENVAPILAASNRAKKLVSQILTFSRQGEQQKLLISLKPVIKETIEFLRSSLPATIQLEQFLIPDAGSIMADPTQMQQILMNLCTNAAHAMKDGGGVLKVELNNATIEAADSRLTAELDPGDYVKLSVSDTGHGMEAWIQERIFDPYFTTKGPGKGTGLGLSVVHGIVKSHGGAIKVYSEPGKGTAFHVYLPRADGMEKTEVHTVQPLPRGTERILFVDDEAALADLGKRMLGFLGYRVDVRTSPVEALELFRAAPQRFDAVVTDMTMPQMTGLNLLREILALRPDLPTILCTGYSDQANEVKALSAGIRSFLIKPLVIADLANELRRAIDENQSARDLLRPPGSGS